MVVTGRHHPPRSGGPAVKRLAAGTRRLVREALQRDPGDRWAAVFARQTNIREVMAFPKTQSMSDLMLKAPSPPDPAQLAELGLRYVGSPGGRER